MEAVGKRWGGPQIAVAVEMVGGAAERRNVSEVKVKSWSLTENRTAVGAMTRVGDGRGQV